MSSLVNEFADFLEERCSLPPDHSTYTLVYDIYETGTVNWEMGLASTMAIVFTIFVVILTIIQNTLTKDKEGRKHVHKKAKTD